ncbi:MAG: ATP-binding protein [Legionella sp.]|jgi:hypothetical protein|nr:ATP-binding protein [Legionella sp.]
MKRIQDSRIISDLSKKMVLLAGPRQVGKTFVAKLIAEEYKNALYLNFDNLDDRKIIQSLSWLDDVDLLVLDELHKMPEWKNYLKGFYDTKPEHVSILVTGSARLDIFNNVGDSLAGRYFLHRLLPLSPSELKQLGQPIDMDALMVRGGFPEPYLAENLIEANRWRMQYSNSMLSTDVFDFDVVHNLKAMRVIFDLLRCQVGSPVSYQSLARDAAVSHGTVKRYIEILEALFIVFRVTPYSKNIARSLLKEPKIYFFDSGLVNGDEGARLENLVAVCLLKHVYAKVDYLAEDAALYYLRTKDGQEVDFALVKDQMVEQIIEVKYADQTISKSLHAFHQRYHYPAIQLVYQLRNDRMVDAIKVVRAERFLEGLMM